MQVPDSNRQWQVPLLDVGDGSGDCFAELPEELVTSLGWLEGDLLEVEQLANGDLRVFKPPASNLPASPRIMKR